MVAERQEEQAVAAACLPRTGRRLAARAPCDGTDADEPQVGACGSCKVHFFAGTTFLKSDLRIMPWMPLVRSTTCDTW